MFKYFFIFIFLISCTNSHAENKDKIIEKLQNTKNLVFEFEQNINGKTENGKLETVSTVSTVYCLLYQLLQIKEKTNLRIAQKTTAPYWHICILLTKSLCQLVS